jgi:hypothetical protein
MLLAMVLTQQMVLLFVLTCGVGVVMLVQGLSKHALERRASRCSNCGRDRKDGVACDCLQR